MPVLTTSIKSHHAKEFFDQPYMDMLISQFLEAIVQKSIDRHSTPLTIITHHLHTYPVDESAPSMRVRVRVSDRVSEAFKQDGLSGSNLLRLVLHFLLHEHPKPVILLLSSFIEETSSINAINSPLTKLSTDRIKSSSDDEIVTEPSNFDDIEDDNDIEDDINTEDKDNDIEDGESDSEPIVLKTKRKQEVENLLNPTSQVVTANPLLSDFL